MDGWPAGGRGVDWERKRGLGDVNKMFLGLMATKRLGLDFVGNQQKKESFGLRLERERI
jgi:hypothetical protein